MGTIKMKIKGYDKESHSLLISFASDETMSNDPEDYPAYAFQTAEICPHTNDIEEVKLQIAIMGIQIVKQQIAKEKIGGNPVAVIELQKMVGMCFEYDKSDLEKQEVGVVVS